jgi:hypothetical protein
MTAATQLVRVRWTPLIAIGMTLGVALVAGYLGARGSVFLGAAFALMLLALGLFAVLGARLVQVFLGVLVVALFGYAYLGRGFSYIGFPPMYVGEMTLAIGVGAAIAAGIHRQIGTVQLLLFALIGWGVFTTVPYIGQYDVDALRDAAFWGYSIFALLVWGLVRTRGVFQRAIGIYRYGLVLFLLWIPAIFILPIASLVPSFPGAPVRLVEFKAGDVGVHLAGIAAFLILGLYAKGGRHYRPPVTAVWLLWALTLMVVAVANRGGFLSASVGVLAVVALRPTGRVLPMAIFGALVVFVVMAAAPTFRIGERTFQIDSIRERTVSIFDRSSNTRQGTVEWRLNWWTEIVGYTFGGEHFWTGKGFGVNLAEDDGFTVEAAGLRSPHNGHMTALARMGVPGFAIWVGFHVTFGLAMLTSYLRAQLRRDPFWGAVMGWLLIYWGAGIVNGAFDVYWEGPQGAIWMWTAIGLGLAALELQREEQRDERSPAPVRAAAMTPRTNGARAW